MPSAGVGPDEDETDEPEVDEAAQRARLWQQLLDGRLTEVYVLCEVGTYWLIPQALGLEPISQLAYTRTPEQGGPIPARKKSLDELARNLSEQRFWITGGGGFTWDQHFMERARIALILLKPSRLEQVLRGVSVLLHRRRKAHGVGFAEEVRPDRAQVKFHKRLADYYRYDRPRYSGGPPIYEFHVATHLLEKYPEKTFIVSSPRELKQLRSLHIPRPPRDGSIEDRADPAAEG